MNILGSVYAINMSKDDEVQSIVPLVEMADMLETHVREELHRNHSEAYELSYLHLEAVGRLSHLFADYLIHNPIEGTQITQETAHLAEIAGYLHDIDKVGNEFLLHHLTSALAADKRVKEAETQGIYLTEEQRTVVANAIKRHQGMPYVDRVALKDFLDQFENGEKPSEEATNRWYTMYIAEPVVLALGRFLPPNDETSAILYSADLLSLGDTHKEGPDPKAGGFDKIVAIELGSGKSLLDAIAAAQRSLMSNVNRLKGAQPYTEQEKREMQIFGFGEREFLGRERAARIERAIGEKFGDAALQRIESLVALASNPPADIKIEDTMDCYYALARANAQNMVKIQ